MAARTPSAKLGQVAPDFRLRAVDGHEYSWADISGEKGTIVAFICNHCPYVKGMVGRLVADFNELRPHGIGMIAIMSNDTVNYPEDSFENMQRFAAQHDFTFPYAIDEDQSVAKAYGAVCTPDLFGFNAGGELRYRGRLDSAGMHSSDSPVRELYNAMIQIAQSNQGPSEQIPSIGCSIKWKQSD